MVLKQRLRGISFFCRTRFLQVLLVIVLVGNLGLALAEDKQAAKLPHKTWDFSELGLTPIQNGGRVKPLEGFAREIVLYQTGSRKFQKWDALDLVISWMSDPHAWENQAFIRVGREDVKRQLGLDEKRTLFSPSELLMNNSLAQYAERMVTASQSAMGQTAGAPVAAEMPNANDPREKELKAVLDRLGVYQSLILGDAWTLVPRPTPDAWGTLMDEGAETQAIRAPFINLLRAYQAEDPAQFKQMSQALRETVESKIPGYGESLKSRVFAESVYHRTRPFLVAWIVYLLAFLVWVGRLAMSADSKNTKRIETLGLILTGLGAAAHVFGFGLRCFIAGRPPVTNMYESVIWVSLGVVFFAFVLFKIQRHPILLAVATALAVLGLISGDAAPTILDSSLSPLVPVLRSNYWLTVHVLTITLAYAAFALTLGLANVSLFYFLKNERMPKINPLNLLTYRAMQFGVVLIAAGTILGGIWADYSWGRFWGWDPKEVWALITLLCYITILHGRYSGWVGPFGFAVWSAVAFLSVLMAWYGVNFILGVGLHSYGFASGGTAWILGFTALELVYILGVCAVIFIRRRQSTPAI